MDKTVNFAVFTKQSPKGIIVIYLNLLIKLFKIGWIFIFLLFRDLDRLAAFGYIYIFLGITAILTFLLLRAYLLYKNFQFKIENQHFILQQGILKKKNTAIPFHRIQNINFKQNIVQQLINVFEVSVETAGSTNTEISIKALSFSDANALKELISKAANIPTETENIEEIKPFIYIDLKSLFKVSLTENHLQNLFLFLAILISFFQQIMQIFDSMGESEFLDGFIEENTNAISFSIVLVLFLTIILLITALLTSFVKVFLIHFNLTAYLKKDAFEINQGLITKKSIVLKKNKVQTITVSTNPLKRLIGISFITFKQAESGVKKKAKKKLIRIVGCKKDQVNTVKNSLFDVATLENRQTKYPDFYYKRRLYTFSFLALISMYVALYVLYPHFEIFYSVLFTIPLLILLIYKKVEKRFYKITETMILVGHGLLETHLTYLELFKVQNIKLKQTIFQKRSNVADIILQTASGKITIPCIKYEEAIAIYNQTLYNVETSKKSWM